MIIRKLAPDKLDNVEKADKQSFSKIPWSKLSLCILLYYISLIVSDFLAREDVGSSGIS